MSIRQLAQTPPLPRLPGRPECEPESSFWLAPRITRDQPGYDCVLEQLEKPDPFTFCKINHGFWERLARLESLGVDRSEFARRDGAEIDRLLGIGGSMLAEGGMLADLLSWIGTRPDLGRGLCFVPGLEPWPHSDRIEGTPFELRSACESLIRHFVSSRHLADLAAHGFSGHEFKVAIITGGIARFIAALQGRDVILLSNAENGVFADALTPASLTAINVHPSEARLQRQAIRDRLFAAIEATQDAPRPPVVLASAGGAMTTWLAFCAAERFARLHFVDLGGALAAFHPATVKKNWIRVYKGQIAQGLAAIPELHGRVPPTLRPGVAVRDPALVALARAAGVPQPACRGETDSPLPRTPLPFIENKSYDFARLHEFLSLSAAENHHANFGPVSRLLERAVAVTAGLADTRGVVATSSGTAALHLACAWHRLKHGTTRWVTSAFNFFSAGIGPLGGTLVLDCDSTGGFDLDALRALPADSYDGVIYTNVFALQPDWKAVADFCRAEGKAFVVDNATGLLDRPGSALVEGAPIEIVSAHHTKPWGVGEGGFVLCDAVDAPEIRQLANFAARMAPDAAPYAQNAKMSDLAAAAILDRLERMGHWAPFYRFQERRMKSLMIDAELGLVPFGGTAKSRSPRAHTPFLAPGPVDVETLDGPLTLRKYYRPLRTAHPDALPTPVANDLFDRIFSLSNAPEMRLVPNETIIAEVRRAVGAGR